MDPLKHIEEMNYLIQDINDILSKHGVNENISLPDVTITNKTISDLVKPHAKLSEAITNYLWPSITSACVYHYTSMEAAENILKTGLFRLNNIETRYTEGEIRTFCETHQLNGYLENDENGDPRYKNLIMPNTFYASFTDTNLADDQEQYFWEQFASCDGVRLKIEITASNPNFRKIYYENKNNKPISILSDLTGCVRSKYGREFILKGISRLCSFYLSGQDYGIENEYRALYRVWEGFGPQPKKGGKDSYIELPLNDITECGYQLKIIEVHSNSKPKMPSSFIYSKRKV